jgi:ABC-type Fe3+/spermidine/putrescine transport system ATPase subunit
VRPEHISIHKGAALNGASADVNVLRGTVKRETYLGEIVEYLVGVEGGDILVRTPLSLDLAKGDAVTLSFPHQRTIALLQS